MRQFALDAKATRPASKLTRLPPSGLRHFRFEHRNDGAATAGVRGRLFHALKGKLCHPDHGRSNALILRRH